MGKVDLHMHSKYSSDGQYEIRELLHMAKENSVEIIAVSDHNSVRGVEEAVRLGKESGIKVLPAIEIDCHYNGTNLHVLGYNIDYSKKEFLSLEADIYNQEVNAKEERLRLLYENTGLKLDYDEVVKRYDRKDVPEELFCEMLLEKKEFHDNKFLKEYLPGGSRSDTPLINFYWDFFAYGKAAYVPMKFMTLREAVKLVKDAGGIPVLAHPGQNLRGNTEELIKGIIEEGIEGIEVFSSYHNDDIKRFYYNIAKNNDLIITCGSDFHGVTKPHISIGCIDGDINIEKLLTEV